MQEPSDSVCVSSHTSRFYMTPHSPEQHCQLGLLSKMSPRPPQTTVVEVILSNNAGMRTKPQEPTFTPTHLHTPVLPTRLALRDSHSQPQPQQPQAQSSSQSHPLEASTTSTTSTNTLPSTPNQRTTSPSLTTLTGTFTTGTTTTIVTITRAHRPGATSTQTSYIEQWPQIGFVPTESDVPAQWRETYEMKALRQQYISLGAVCGIFIVGVLGVLGFAVWRCVREGRPGRREESGEREGRWDWW